MALPQSFVIVRESSPDRCEICHQSDMFDAIAISCTRCDSVVMKIHPGVGIDLRRDTLEDALQEINLNDSRAIFVICENWLRYVYRSIFIIPLCSAFGVSVVYGTFIDTSEFLTLSILFTFMVSLGIVFGFLSVMCDGEVILKALLYVLTLLAVSYLALVMGYIAFLSY